MLLTPINTLFSVIVTDPALLTRPALVISRLIHICPDGIAMEGGTEC